MSTLILLSLLIAMVVVPIRAAAEPRPRRALRRMAWTLVLFTPFYLVAVRFIWPRFL
jgi:hypothetical protein